jgi:excisionase family DNA binding protein
MPRPKRIDEQKPLSWQDAPAMLTPPQCARVLGMHVNSIDKAIRAGRLSYTKVGRVRKITKQELARFAGITLNSAGGILTDDGTLLTHYAKKFDKAIERLRDAQDARGEALTEIQSIVDEMRNE